MQPLIFEKLQLKKLHSGVSFENSWSTTTTNGSIISINPSNGETLAEIYCSSHKDYDQLIAASNAAFQTWRQVPAPKRAEVIRQLAELLRANKSMLGSLISLESGKSKQEGDGEVQEMIDMADFAVGQSRMLYGKTMHSERPQHRMYEQWHPLGIVGVITAFNFPVAVWAWNAFIAIICGNTVVWKPSSKTPLCAIAVQHLCNQVMQANGYANLFTLLISEEQDLLNYFIDDKRIPLISFTGSTAVGRHINQKVAQRLGRCLLELSGNNAIIIDADANLELAVPAIVFGAIGTSGQRCTTTRRLIIHEAIYDILVKRLVAAYKQIKIGDPLDENNLMGPLIDQQAVTQYQQAIQTIKQVGGKILYGGNTLQQAGFYVEPTLAEVENHWDIVQQETFAPILYLIRYKTLDEAIQLHNQSRYGLSSAIFTENLKVAETFLSAQGSDCGIANVNIGTSGAEIGGAFGGEKDTGGGREAGSDAWKTYMRRQTTTINWGNELPLAQGIEFFKS